MKIFEIVIGTYEEFLVGYEFFDHEARLNQSFATHDHSASLRSLATCNNYVASGGADDRIIIYDFKLRKEHCMLSHHNATINCLAFTPNHSHILSGSQDGVLAITRVGNWQVEKHWEKAHKGSAIIDVAVHPTGKLALSLGEDCTLRTWNLVKGRQAYAINLKSKSKDAKNLFKISWADDGIRFILFGGKFTEIWSIETGGILQVIEHEGKVSSCIWYSDKKILVGYEDGNICLVKLSSLKKNLVNVHKDRVKVIAKYEDWIVTGSSSGEIKVFNLNLDEVCKTNSGCRITSLVIVLSIQMKKEEHGENILIEEEDHISEPKTVKIKKRKKKIQNTTSEGDDVTEELQTTTVTKKKRQDTTPQNSNKQTESMYVHPIKKKKKKQ